MNLTLRVWRQKNRLSVGQFETYQLSDVSEDSSFLEMLDILSEQLVAKRNKLLAKFYVFLSKSSFLLKETSFWLKFVFFLPLRAASC